MAGRYTKTEIAENSGIHLGRVSYYFKQFPEYFEEHQVKGKVHPVYDESAIEIVKLIGDMIKTSSHNEIRSALNEAGYSPIIEMIDKSTAIIESGNINETIAIDVVEKNIETQIRVINTLTRMNEQQADIIGKLEQENRDLREENEELKRKVDKQNRPGLIDRLRGKSSDD
jgi:hypothetical protein